MYEYKFPDIGEGITEGTLLKLAVQEGDTVKKARIRPRWKPTK